MSTHTKQVRTSHLLDVSGLSVDTPGGRPLFRGLHLSIGREKVAIVGRNGVGKSTLLRLLAGEEQETQKSGVIRRYGRLVHVPQHIPPQAHTLGWSHGERRRLALEEAWRARPALLLLDEPSEALDTEAQHWLHEHIMRWEGGLIVASHDRTVLACFTQFIVLSEAGGWGFEGDFAAFEAEFERRALVKQKEYAHELQVLARSEWHNARVTRRRARKKRLGRIHELARGPSRALLNTNRSYAQVSQGRASKIRKERQAQKRNWARSARRALDANLPISSALPVLPPVQGEAIVSCQEVSCSFGERVLFAGVSLHVEHERWAILGPNGAGKSCLLDIIMGANTPSSGEVHTRHHRLGYISQHAENWKREESLLSLLSIEYTDPNAPVSLDALAQTLVAHRFPLALAERPLVSLSPGERVRAALICLFAQRPVIECLVLDEPTTSLDFLGWKALGQVLSTWEGGLIVASHDQAFLQSIGVTHSLTLGV